MHSRSLRALSTFAAAAAFTALTLGYATSAHAGPKDKDAEKLLKAAIDEDYLNAEFDKAEKKLKDAVAKCGSSGCSPELVGRIHVALGTVYGVAQSKPADAKDEFVLALKADSGAALDPNLSNADLQKIFADAKKSAGGGGASKPEKPEKTDRAAPSGDASHTPPPESQVNTPLPIYVEPTDEVPLSKVVLKYKPFGATQYKSLELKKVGKGFGGEVPCEDVTTTGDVKYFFVLTGTDGDAAGELGSSKQPFKTTIKNELEGDAPKLPGRKPPNKCQDKADCPPGLAGCGDVKSSGEKHGEKGWGASCDQTSECKEGLTCVNGTCDESKGDDDGKKKDEGGAKRMNLVGVFAQFDFLKIAGTGNACDGSQTQYECFISGSTNQFVGTPVAYATTDGIQGGGAFAGARILAAYDRQLSRKVGITLGARVGYAFGGPPAPTNTQMLLANGGIPVQPIATKFFPFHGEARLAWYILGSMMDDKKFRPYFFAGGGVGQVNASVPVAVCDSNIYPNETGQSCPTTKKTLLRSVDAYQVTGLGFIDLGVGTTFGITPLFGIAAELKFMFLLPTFGVGIAPNIGPVFNF